MYGINKYRSLIQNKKNKNQNTQLIFDYSLV